MGGRGKITARKYVTGDKSSGRREVKRVSERVQMKGEGVNILMACGVK